MLSVTENMSWDEKKMLIQTALTQGFFSESAEFPVVSRSSSEKLPKTLEDLTSYLPRMEQVVPENYIVASDYAQPINAFDWRKQKGLENIFQPGTYLKDNNLDLLPDYLDVSFILPENASVSMLIAASNFAYRFGMETTAVNGWLLKEKYQSGNAVIFKEAAECRLFETKGNHGTILTMQGSGSELELFSRLICMHFPKLADFETWTSFLQSLIDGFSFNNLDGQLAYLHALGGQPATAFLSPEINQVLPKLVQLFPNVLFKSYKEMQKVYAKEYDLQWEVTAFHQALQEKIYPELKPDDQVEIIGVLSEEKAVRQQVAKTIFEEVSRKRAKLKTTQIVCAHKQGYSWIEEYIIPQLKKHRIAKLSIAFKAFLPDGVTEWTEESGVVPSYNNLDRQDTEKWNDLPIRYLQELYPIQDTLIRELSLNKEKIEFVTYDDAENVTYVISAVDEEGQEVCRETYTASCSERPYLDEYSGMGKVHPPTGFIKVLINGELKLEQQIATDIEQIWNIYQTEILPDCKSFIEAKYSHLSPNLQPFFSRLQIEVTASEPDFLLESRNDLISSLDALHEDIYFAGTDYFKNYGCAVCGKMFEEPGLILPVIKQAKGKPTLKVSLLDQLKAQPEIVVENKPVHHPDTREAISVILQEIKLKDQKLAAVVSVTGVEEAVLEAYLELLNLDIVGQDYDFGVFGELSFLVGTKKYSLTLKEHIEQEESISIEEINLYEDQVIGYEKYVEIMEQLKKVAGISVYPIATSYLGRKIYAIELKPKASGYTSMTKRLTNHPSELINARHHANEVSGTNGAFLLVKELLTKEKYQNLAEQLNLVIVPLENVDGAAIHYELQQDNPYWKLHVARFNAVGKEFYYEYFNPETKHPEAKGITRLYEKFLPDVMVDNHGVPTHEWEQPFSGYTSPSYKGFWLPRSLLYGYYWVVSDEEYHWNISLNKKLEDTIADAIGTHPEIKRWNIEWAGQFETYAHKWLPKLFPAEYYKEMINYWIPFSADIHHRYPSIRYPWITSVAYTSEVADETAQGKYLTLSAQAHVVHDLATIDLLRKAQLVYRQEEDISAKTFLLCHTRLRPIIA